MEKIEHSRISSNGKIAIENLNKAYEIIKNLPLEDSVSDEQNDVADDIFQICVRVAGLCCGSERWCDTYLYLTEAGFDVPDKFSESMSCWDSIADKPFFPDDIGK